MKKHCDIYENVFVRKVARWKSDLMKVKKNCNILANMEEKYSQRKSQVEGTDTWSVSAGEDDPQDSITGQLTLGSPGSILKAYKCTSHKPLV